MVETARLVKTVEAWQAIIVALAHDVFNARTESFNRVIKQNKGSGCGYRSMARLSAPVS
jgi:transposase